jgi:hypothetical protein
MSDMQNREIRAGLGSFNRPVVCRIAEDGLEIARGADVTRIGYDALSEIRFHRRGAGRAVLGIRTLDGNTTTLRLMAAHASNGPIDDFVKSLLERVALSSPGAAFVSGPSRTQWIASWIGVLASGAVLLLSAWSLAAGGQIGPMLMPVGIALVNLAIVVPILWSGKPRQYPVADATILPG